MVRNDCPAADSRVACLVLEDQSLIASQGAFFTGVEERKKKPPAACRLHGTGSSSACLLEHATGNLKEMMSVGCSRGGEGVRRRRRREPHLPTQLLFRSTGISCSNKKHPSLRRCGRWCCSSCSWCPAHQLQQIAFSADFPSAFMEADYDIYLGAAFNQGNDVFSRNVSYAWKEEEVDAEAAAGDGMEFVVSIVVPIIFGLIVVVGFFGTRLYSPQAGDCSLAKRLWIERKRERDSRLMHSLRFPRSRECARRHCRPL